MRGCCMFLALLTIILSPSPAPAKPLPTRAGNRIDPATGTISKNQIILIKDQKIFAVGPTVSIPTDAQVIDLSNEWIMPGVIDSHTHVTFLLPNMSTPLEENYLEVSRGMRVLQGLKIAQT